MAQRNRNNIRVKIQTYTQIQLSTKIIRAILFFYAFLSFVFWFLNCFEVDWLWRFNWLFLIPYQIVGLFYKPEGVSADFSLAIIGAVTLLFGFIADAFVTELYKKIAELVDEEERIKRSKRLQAKKQKERERERRRPVTPNDIYEYPSISDLRTSEEIFASSKLLFLILPQIKKIKKKNTDLELTFQEVELWKQRVNKKLIEHINYTKPMQKGYYRKNLFLVYKDFNYVDEFIYYFRPTLDTIVSEFKSYGIRIDFAYILNSIDDMQNLEKELDCMDTVLSLNFLGEIIVTNRFKLTYDNKMTKKYNTKLKGEYNLSKNLSISNRQILYSLIEKTKKGEDK